MAYGGGISCDGLTQCTTGTKFYDLVVHYIDLSKPHAVTGKLSGRFFAKVLVLKNHKDAESADAIRHTLNKALRDDFSTSLSELMTKCTFVTDWANTLPCVVGS